MPISRPDHQHCDFEEVRGDDDVIVVHDGAGDGADDGADDDDDGADDVDLPFVW